MFEAELGQLAELLSTVRAIRESRADAGQTDPGQLTDLTDTGPDADDIEGTGTGSAPAQDDTDRAPAVDQAVTEDVAEPGEQSTEPVRAGATIARLRAVDDKTGDCFIYQTADENGELCEHPWLAVRGHDLCLARDFDEAEVPAGPITLHLRVTDAGDNVSRETLVVDLKAWFARENRTSGAG